MFDIDAVRARLEEVLAVKLQWTVEMMASNLPAAAIMLPKDLSMALEEIERLNAVVKRHEAHEKKLFERIRMGE